MSYSEGLADAELVAQHNAGDSHAFYLIFDRYWPVLYRHAARMLKDGDDAKDVVQDVFRVLLESPKIQTHIPIKLYLYKMVRNKVLGLFQRAKVRSKYEKYLHDFLQNAPVIIDDQLLQKELEEIIDSEINYLPERMKVTFELSRKKHYDYRQISKITKTSTETVRTQIHNALKILRARIEHRLPDSFNFKKKVEP